MLHVTIDLSEAQNAELSARVAKGGFTSLDDYVMSLIRNEMADRERERLESLLLEGLEGEADTRPLGEIFDDIRRKAGLTR